MNFLLGLVNVIVYGGIGMLLGNAGVHSTDWEFWAILGLVCVVQISSTAKAIIDYNDKRKH
jgi:hypothetical protein